jgi:hypothetical protein
MTTKTKTKAPSKTEKKRATTLDPFASAYEEDDEEKPCHTVIIPAQGEPYVLCGAKTSGKRGAHSIPSCIAAGHPQCPDCARLGG